MASPVKALTEKRKSNLRKTGKARNRMAEPGLKPSGIANAEDVLAALNFENIDGKAAAAWGSVIAGAALATYGGLGLTKKFSVGRLVATAAGAGLLTYGASIIFTRSDEMSEDDTGMENPASSVGHLEGIKVEKEIVIEKPARECYDFWRNFSNLPKIMSHLESVEIFSDTVSHWTAKAPAGTSIEWDAEVYIDKVGELISWRSTEDAEVDNAGSVRFEDQGDDTTLVSVMLKYDPPAGVLGAAFAKLFGEDPATQIEEDLEHFKDVMESTPSPAPRSTSGSNGSTGRRSFH